MASPLAARGDDAAPDAVLDQGLRSMAAGDLEKACPLIADAVKRPGEHTLRGLLALAECHEKAGHLARATDAYGRAVSVATQQGRTASREQAEAAVARLAPKLARIRIVVAPAVGGIAGLSVKRGDDLVANDAWGIAVPVDPGTIVVRAEAPGKRPFVSEVKLDAGDEIREVRIDALEALPAKPVPNPTTNSLAEPIDDPRWGKLGTAGAIIGGAGLATLAVSLGLALKSSSDHDDALANPAFECGRGGCNAAGQQAVDDASYLSDVATATALIGATLTAAGATMVIIELAAPIVKQQSIALGFGPGTLSISGRFQ
jgi:hypothetical protein